MLTVWAVIPLISCIAHLGVLTLVLLYSRRRVHSLFAVYIAVAAIWSFSSFMLHLDVFPQQAILWHGILNIAMMWTLLAYYHFVLIFARKSAGIGPYIGYAMLMAFTTLSFLGYIVKSAYVINGVLYHDLGIALYLMGAGSLFFIGAVIFLLVKRYRGSLDPADRNRTAYLIMGWSILVVFSYTNFIPAVAGLSLDHIGNLANALIITYAILRYQLLDIKLIARKGLAYSSLTVFLTAIYLLLLFVLQMSFLGWVGYSSLAIAAGFALFIAVLFIPLRNFSQKWIDRVFYRETYDYRQMLLSFSGRISNVLELDELANSMLAPIVKAMHAKRAALLLPAIDSGDFTTQFVQQASNEEAPTNFRLVNSSPIVKWLGANGRALRRELVDIIPQFKGLWEEERTVFERQGIELLCPIRSKGNLIGVLAVGKKQSDSQYSDEEIDLLMTMANEAAVAIENAKMLDSLKIQELRVRQLLAQAVSTQEEERKRISVDLHDSVAQWLAAASYRVQTFSALVADGNNSKARDELEAMETTINKSLKELRRLMIGLRPPALDELGLNHALRQSLEELKADGIVCGFREVGTPVRLASSTEIAVYRIVQEALANIRKHAGATKVNISLQFLADRLIVEVRDNGRGFDFYKTLDSAISVGRMGLLGMKQRVETLGGDIRINTREGAGTTIILSLPTQSREGE